MEYKFQTKLKPGDAVFYISENRLRCGIVRKVFAEMEDVERIGMKVNTFYNASFAGGEVLRLPEYNAYATKQELLDYLSNSCSI